MKRHRTSPTGTALPPLTPQKAAKRVRAARSQLRKSNTVDAAMALQKAELDHRDAFRDHLRLAVNNVRPKLLVLGYGRHGKDTVAELLRDRHGFRFISSSEFVGRECLWDAWGRYRYADFDAMYADRHNHRETWMQLIARYNTPDKTRTARTMLERGYDLYVGMRRLDELEASRHLFDYVLWVDRSRHQPPETGSMDITLENARPDLVIDNNGSLEDLRAKILETFSSIGLSSLS